MPWRIWVDLFLKNIFFTSNFYYYPHTAYLVLSCFLQHFDIFIFSGWWLGFGKDDKKVAIYQLLASNNKVVKMKVVGFHWRV